MSNYQDMHGLVDLMQLAAITPRQESTSATPEQVELVVGLRAVSRALNEQCRQVIQGEGGGRWAELADMLGVAAEVCRRQAPGDVGQTQRLDTVDEQTFGG